MLAEAKSNSGRMKQSQLLHTTASADKDNVWTDSKHVFSKRISEVHPLLKTCTLQVENALL